MEAKISSWCRASAVWRAKWARHRQRRFLTGLPRPFDDRGAIARIPNSVSLAGSRSRSPAGGSLRLRSPVRARSLVPGPARRSDSGSDFRPPRHRLLARVPGSLLGSPAPCSVPGYGPQLRPRPGPPALASGPRLRLRVFRLRAKGSGLGGLAPGFGLRALGPGPRLRTSSPRPLLQASAPRCLGAPVSGLNCRLIAADSQTSRRGSPRSSEPVHRPCWVSAATNDSTMRFNSVPSPSAPLPPGDRSVA